MSFNAPSFRSYGWAQNANAPVSVDRALAYTMALNEMLKPGSPYRHDEGEVAFLCWLQRPAPLYPTLMVNEAPPQSRIREVKKILALEHDPALKGNLFHMLALSANGGRLIVRSSLIEELDTVAANVVSWWEGLQIRPLRRNKPISVPRLWQLKLALDRKGDPPNNRTTALWNRALGGASRPLGYQIIGDVINRMRADKTKRLDPAAIGLLRLSLNDIFYGNGKGELIPVALEKTNANEKPAYVCGRLLALHDDLQYITFDLAGESQPPFTVADRFYALVMNSPAIGIGKVFDLGRKHLRMLRRLSRLMPDVRHGGAQIAFDYEQAIGDLEKMLNGEPPVRFGMHDKARFALGFYHQKGLRWRHDVRPDGESLGGREEASEEEKVVEL
jgi:CRISPR-associated protein Csd1